MGLKLHDALKKIGEFDLRYKQYFLHCFIRPFPLGQPVSSFLFVKGFLPENSQDVTNNHVDHQVLFEIKVLKNRLLLILQSLASIHESLHW